MTSALCKTECPETTSQNIFKDNSTKIFYKGPKNVRKVIQV